MSKYKHYNQGKEKKPHLGKILALRVWMSLMIAGILCIFTVWYLKQEYIRYVNAVTEDIRENFEREAAENYIRAYLEEERLQTKLDDIVEKYCQSNLKMLPILQFFANDSLADTESGNDLIEIRIYNEDMKFIVSNMAKNIREYEGERYQRIIRKKAKVVYSNVLYFPDNLSYRYQIVSYYCFKNDVQSKAWIYEVLLFAAAISCGICISLATYYKRKMRYDSYEYRRRITGAMAHDLKSPLMIISGYAQNLQEGERTKTEQHFIENILETVTYMDEMIAKSLELYKLEDKDCLSLPLKPLQADKILNTVLDTYEEVLEKRKLSVTIHGTCRLRGDLISFTNIITNVISNIAKYAKTGSEVRIEMTNQKIEFTNEMEGTLQVPAEELFTPFVKGNQARTGQEGTGLGLAIVRELCRLQGLDARICTTDQLFVIEIIGKSLHGK